MDFLINNVEFFVFVLFLSVFLYLKRKKLDVQGSFPFLYMMMYKTSLGLDKMDKWSSKHPKIFLYLAYLSIFIGIVGTILMFIFMFWQLGFIIDNNLETGGGLVLPIKTEAGLDSAVPVFYVPFWYWLIALIVLVIVHEFAHGVIAERFKIKIKSSGFAFLGIFVPIMPAAFVEPDEKILKKKPLWQQIAVFGAGSTSNFIFGFLFLLVWIFVAGSFIDNTQKIGDINFINIENSSPLKQFGFEKGQIISLNGIYNSEMILDEFKNLSVNQSINLEILDKNTNKVQNYTINTIKSEFIEGKGRVGIELDSSSLLVPKEQFSWLGSFPLKFERLIFYIWFLNIAIGMMNLLPIWITDGGQIAKGLLGKYFREKKAMRIYHFISWISLILIIFTIFPSLLLDLISLI